MKGIRAAGQNGTAPIEMATHDAQFVWPNVCECSLSELSLAHAKRDLATRSFNFHSLGPK